MAITPAECAADAPVPDRGPYELPGRGARILDPGAAKSGLIT